MSTEQQTVSTSDLSALLDAAELEFDRLGPRKTTMADIAAAAGVSRPTLYRAFGDRTALIEAVVDRRAGRVAAKLERMFGESEVCADRLIRGMTLVIEAGRSDELLSGLLRSEQGRYTNADQLRTPFLAQVWKPVLDQAREKGELREDLHDDEAFTWLTLVTMAMVRWPDPNSTNSPPDERILRSFLLPAFIKPGAGTTRGGE